MARICVKNVPSELYEALTRRALAHSRSISDEVISLLQEQLPTETELSARRRFARRLLGFDLERHLPDRPSPLSI